MARKLREQVQEQRAAREVSARLEALLEELSAQEPYLDYTKASWGRCRQQAGLELEYATVLARMYPGSLREEAVELKGFHRGAWGSGNRSIRPCQSSTGRFCWRWKRVGNGCPSCGLSVRSEPGPSLTCASRRSTSGSGTGYPRSSPGEARTACSRPRGPGGEGAQQ